MLIRLCATAIVFCLAAGSAAFARPPLPSGLYVHSYGDPNRPAAIFVHGGPGYDSQDFELTTAAPLAARGYFVVVYDQRGQGRSALAESVADYSYARSSEDLKQIIDALGLVRPSLIGHSHGGPIALEFDRRYPGVAGKIALVSAPVNAWALMESLRVNCRSRLERADDLASVATLDGAIDLLASRQASREAEIRAIATAFRMASVAPCSLYQPSAPTAEARDLRAQVARLRQAPAMENLTYPMAGFQANDDYIHVDRTAWVRARAARIFGIYGDEDGLFTPGALRDVEAALATNPRADRLQVLQGASHAVYLDRQEEFLEALTRVLR